MVSDLAKGIITLIAIAGRFNDKKQEAGKRYMELNNTTVDQEVSQNIEWKKLENITEGEKFDLLKANTEEENKFNAHMKRNKLIILIIGKTMVQMLKNTNI